jgi:16S rRNA pseudouridine516 synthase
MTLLQALQAQGAGSRKVCLAIIADGEAFIDGIACTNPKQIINDPQTVSFMFDDDLCHWQDRIVIMMHKPLGYECSAKPSHHPSVLDLLPAIHLARNVQPVGRLDVDTSGLLLLTDDGQLIHQLTHPKRHVPKTYQITTIDAIDQAQIDALWQEIQLNDEPKPVKALSVAQTGTHRLSLVIDEGRYHQVRRMIAAVGNRVETLSRSHIGVFALPDDLPSGQWRSVDDSMLVQIQTPHEALAG